MNETQGRRIYADAEGNYPYGDIKPGDFFLWREMWHGMTPNGMLCNLRGHEVVEHEDKTITVRPSILTSNGEGAMTWHGFLEHGIWREC